LGFGFSSGFPNWEQPAKAKKNAAKWQANNVLAVLVANAIVSLLFSCPMACSGRWHLEGDLQRRRLQFSSTPRLMEFCSLRELQNQTSHQAYDWPLVVAKGLFEAISLCPFSLRFPEFSSLGG
jgi:hypothetical protein